MSKTSHRPVSGCKDPVELLEAMEKIQSVEARLNQMDFIVIDGGTGTEIEKLAGLGAMDKRGWSCYCNVTHPEVVKTVHRKYLEAGADIIIANTYATNPNVMAAAGFSKEEQERTTLEGCRLAWEAVHEYAETTGASPALVAGSLSCHPPAMPEGAEFHEGTWPPPAVEERNCLRQAELLREGRVDVIFLEMVWDLQHGLRAIRAASAVGLPVFAAVCVPLPMSGPLTEEALRRLTVPGDEIPLGGTGPVSVVDAVRELTQYSNVIGVNVHHTPLPFVRAALQAVRDAGWGGLLGVYPDHGTFKNPHWEALDLDLPRFMNHCEDWVERTGVKAVGGCCGIGPEVIAAVDGHRFVLRDRLSAYRRRQTLLKDLSIDASRSTHLPSPKVHNHPPVYRHPVLGGKPLLKAALFVILLLLFVRTVPLPGNIFGYGGRPHHDAMPEEASAPSPTIPPLSTATPRQVQKPKKRRECSDQWRSLWYFMADEDSDGTVTRSEFASFLEKRPTLLKRVLKRASQPSVQKLLHLLDGGNTGVVSTEDFARVWKTSIVGTQDDPCPPPVARKIRKPREGGTKRSPDGTPPDNKQKQQQGDQQGRDTRRKRSR